MRHAEFDIHFAPLQGYTGPEYRAAYAEVFGDEAVGYFYTPFLRVDGDRPDSRGLRDAAAALKAHVPTVPQIIFGSVGEFDLLAGHLRDMGARRIDLNLGCPFAPQVRRGRGSGLLRRPDVLAAIAPRIAADTDVEYSAKMRLGVESPDESLALVSVLRDMPLRHVTVHPRTARQQYGGEVDLDAFGRLAPRLGHPVIYNGDIRSAADIRRLLAAFPDLSGVMIGRGLLAAPWLAAEWRTGAEWGAADRLAALGDLHRRYSERLAARLCGPAQLLAGLRPFWEYLEPAVGRRACRRILKARSLDAYHAAVAAALRGE